jgi:hypothetical protein
LSTGFARKEDDTSGGEHRNESIATLSPYRTMRYGLIPAFLASSLVHSDLLAHVIARAKAIRQLLQYDSPAASAGKPPFKIGVWCHRSADSNQVENITRLQVPLRNRRGSGSKDIAVAPCDI